MMDVTVKYNKATMDLLKTLPDKEIYEVARQTLDRVGSMKITPYKTGRMEGSMFSTGVKKSSPKVYTIGNYTKYAVYVYKRPQNTKWTNPNSKAKWFNYFWKTQGNSVIDAVVKRNKI